ncbi:hypothetical protein HAX54_016659, partial [Datura stramonium]|nr:hypothetical protein [Datura stramonium]
NLSKQYISLKGYIVHIELVQPPRIWGVTLVPRNKITNRQADLVVKNALASMGNSSSDDEDEDGRDDNQSLISKEEESNKFLTLMAHSSSKIEYDIGK